MKFARYVFGLASAYGLLVTLPLFFSEQRFGIDYPPPITHAEYFYSFAAMTLVWQLLFIAVAVRPLRYRVVIPFCILEKLGLLPAFIIMFPQGRFPLLWIPLMLIDFAFGAAFAAAFFKTREMATKESTAR